MPHRVLILDKTDSITPWWDLGSNFGDFDEVFRVASWSEATESLSALANVDHLQIWGHGSPGRSLINQTMVPSTFYTALKQSLNPGALVWFRQCAVFAGLEGNSFARCIAGFGFHAVGHTRNISTPSPIHHSGGFALAPGKSPHWSVSEGLSKKTGLPLGSSPFVKNTILATTMSVPTKWWG